MAKEIKDLDYKPKTWHEALKGLKAKNPHTDVMDIGMYAAKVYPGLREAALGDRSANERAYELVMALTAKARLAGREPAEFIQAYIDTHS